MDEILMSEVIIVVLEREQGVTLEEFAELFYQVHGYQLKLEKNGYKTLKDLLEDMKDVVELQNVNGFEVIKYRPPCQPNIISPCMEDSSQENDPHMPETCSASSDKCRCCQSGDEFLNRSQEHLKSEVSPSMEAATTKMQLESNEVKIINQKIRSNPTGLRVSKLRKYMLDKHQIDLELYSQELGYTDMLSMLKQTTNIIFPNTSGKKVIIASELYKKPSEDHPTTSMTAECSNAGPSCTSRSIASTQPNTSMNGKQAYGEALLSTTCLSQENKPIVLETSIHEPGFKTDHLFTEIINQTQPTSSEKDPTVTLPVDGTTKKKKRTTTQKTLEEIVKIISEKVIKHHLGLKPKTLRQYFMKQYNIDLEMYSKQLGYTDMLSMLKHIPGIEIADDSRNNVMTSLYSQDKPNNSQTAQPSNDPFSWKIVSDVLKLFPSGLRVEKLKQQVLNSSRIDLAVLSKELGYTDMQSMLTEVPGIQSINGDVFIASDIQKSKVQPMQVKKVKFSDKQIVALLKRFPFGLKVETLRKHMKNYYKIDLLKYSQENGYTDMISMLKNIPGITVANKNLIIASVFLKNSTKKANATLSKFPLNAGTGVTKNPPKVIKTPQDSQTAKKPDTTRRTGPGQQISCSPNDALACPQNVQKGLSQNVSYDLACARKDQINTPLPCPSSLIANEEKDHLFTGRLNQTQPTSSHKDPAVILLVDGTTKKPQKITTTQKTSEEIVKIISEKVVSNHSGLKPKTLRQYFMKQYHIDLEMYSKQLGYTDMLSMLKHIPGIEIADDLRNNVMTSLDSPDKPNNTQTAHPSNDPFFWKIVSDVLKLFPSGLRVEKLKQQVLNSSRIDLEVLSKELGYTDMQSMLTEVPGIQSINGDVFIASDIQKSKAQPMQVKKVKFSDKHSIVAVLENFPLGLKVEKLREQTKNNYNIDLLKYSQDNGYTDMIDILKNIPGITVVNKKFIASKFLLNAGTEVTQNAHDIVKTPQGSLNPDTTRQTGPGQQLSLPTQVLSTCAAIACPENVQRGLRSNVSYASACANNLRNVQNIIPLQCPPSFNHTAKTAQPNHKGVPKEVLSTSKIKENLQVILKSHANGLSIFQLKRLYLVQFQQPLVFRGLSLRKLLMDMKDIAKVKGKAVQAKVYPIFVKDDPSASANVNRDLTAQGNSALNAKVVNDVLTPCQDSRPLQIKKKAENRKPSIPVPSSSGICTSIPNSGDIGDKQPMNHNQLMTENCGKNVTAILHPANNHVVCASQSNELKESFDPSGIARHINDAQWPSLPQKFNILKGIKQRAKESAHLQAHILTNEPCLKHNPSATLQPTENDNSVQTTLQANQEPSFSFVLEETGFTFVTGETNLAMENKSLESGWTGSPSHILTDSAHVVLDISDTAIKSPATPLQLKQSAQCSMPVQIKGDYPEHNRKSVSVSTPQSMSDSTSENGPQKTMTPGTVGSKFSLPSKKSKDSVPPQNSTNYSNKNVDSFLLETKSQATCEISQNDVSSLQLEGIKPICDGGHMVTMHSKVLQDASSSKSVGDYGQEGSTKIPSKQKVTKPNFSSQCGLVVSPESKCPENPFYQKKKTSVGTLQVLTDENVSGAQSTSNVSQLSLLSQIPPVNTNKSPILHTLYKDINVTIVNDEEYLTNQINKHSQSNDEVDGAETPHSLIQQRTNADHVYTHEQIASAVELSRYFTGTHQHYNVTADKAAGQEKIHTSNSYQHFSPLVHSVTDSLSQFSNTQFDQQEDSEDSPEGQTSSEWSCCIL